MATVCVGDSTCRLPSDESDLSLLTRRGASLHDGGATRSCLLDAMYDSPSRAYCEGEKILGRLSSLDGPLLRICRAALPANTVESAMLAMDELYPRTHRAPATRLVRVQADFTHEIAMVELNGVFSLVENMYGPDQVRPDV